MKNVLILHGTNNNSKGNWFPWLKQELEKKNIKTWVPDLPQSDKPSIKRYSQHILKNKNWQFNDQSIIIGHSSGSVAILGLLEALPKNTKVNTCILISSFKDDLGWDVLDGLFPKPFNFEKIKSKSKRFILIHSDNDPYCPLSHAQYLAKKLKGKLIIKKGQKHFNLKAGEKYKRFPFLLKLVNQTKF